LKPVTGNESGLHWMQLVTLRQTFDGRDLFSLRHHGKG
jgi:hypothetical protein